MRINHPISQREHPFPDGETLVSSTDLQGRIRYCNAAFVEVSGYSREELIGQPHNLIRHPDMPAEAFRDMWASLKSGQPWSAMVKNRRKNGDHYWVMANVTPLIDARGQPAGYMSVRTQPTRAQVQAAEALYTRMRADAASGSQRLRLQHGQLHDMGWLPRLGRRLRPGLRAQITGACAAVGTLAVVSHALLPGVATAVAVAGLALLGSQWIRHLTLKPLETLADHAHRMAGCDLTLDFTSNRADEVGLLTRALSQLNVNLMSVVRDARNGVMQIRQDTGVIAEGNLNLSTRTESQASSLQETAASMEQITSTIRQSTDMALQAIEQASTARDMAEGSQQAVQALAGTMTRISEASDRIGAIIQVIDGIAFQTNILSLNAAVEAARAGEQGRGFAVVAGEVRALAQRSAAAAREIRGLIQASVAQVAEGNQQTGHVRQTMDQAQAAAAQVHAFIQQIGHGMREQMIGVQQINQAVSEMDAMTQQNAALVEEIAASATGLRGRADEVADSVGVFRLKGSAATRNAETA